jgi:transcription termination/antitermination protein NusG
LEWFALYVKSRHEFVTDGELVRKGFQTFLPSIARQQHWKDRKKHVLFPLFPGYLFVSASPENDSFAAVLKTRGAVRLISSGTGRPTPVPDAEIDSLRLMIQSGKDFDIYPNLKEGMPVRVTKGPLRGAEGLLSSKENQSFFLVNVNLLGRSAAVRVQADCVESL